MTTIRPDMITAYCLDRIAAFTPLAVMLAFLLSVAGCAVFRQPLIWRPGPVEIVPGVGVRGVCELGMGIRLAEGEKAEPNGNCNGYVFPAYEGMEAHTDPTGAVTVVTLRNVRDDALMPESAVSAPRWAFKGRIGGVEKDLDSLRMDDIIATFGKLPKVDNAFYWKGLLDSCGIPARVSGSHLFPDSEIFWYPKIGLYVTCRRGSGRIMEVTAVSPEEISGGVSLDGSIPLSLFSSDSDAGIGFSGPDFGDGNLHLFTIINDTGQTVKLKRAVSVSPELLCECAAITLGPGEETYMGFKLYKCTSDIITLPLKGIVGEGLWSTIAVKIMQNGSMGVEDEKGYLYSYDPIGSRTSSAVYDGNGVAVESVYAANALNQYTLRTAPEAAFAYDDDGNMVSDGAFAYVWNGENRMVLASNAQTVVTFAYDHQGRMVRKMVAHGNADVRDVTCVWDGYNIVRELVLSNDAPSVAENVWGLDLDGTVQGAGGVGGLLAVFRGGAAYLPAYDANGNVTEYVAASDGAVPAHYDYSPFGGIVLQTGSLAGSFTHRFSTKPWCGVTGLYEYQFRKYHPVLGRWMSRDPICEVWGKFLYHLCRNNVVNNYDYLGKIECCKCAYTGNVLHTYESSGFHTLGKSKCFSGVVGQFLDVTLDYACYPRFFISGIGDCDAKTCKVITTYRCQFFKVHDKLNIVSYYWVYISDRVLPCFRAVP